MIPRGIEQGVMEGSSLIQGLDSGIVTTTKIGCLNTRTLFESVNRYQVLEAGEIVRMEASPASVDFSQIFTD